MVCQINILLSAFSIWAFIYLSRYIKCWLLNCMFCKNAEKKIKKWNPKKYMADIEIRGKIFLTELGYKVLRQLFIRWTRLLFSKSIRRINGFNTAFRYITLKATSVKRWETTLTVTNDNIHQLFFFFFLGV